jgi:FkbH-like protein
MKASVDTDRPSGLAAASLAETLRAQRKEIAQAFARALADTPKWAPMMRDHRSDWDAFLQTHFHALADYLTEYFARGDETFKYLLVGEEIKNLYDPGLDASAARAQTLAVGARERSNLEELLRNRLPEAGWTLLSAHLADVHRMLSAQSAAKTQHVLLVGDCVFLDIVPFVVGELLDAGIAIVPDYATSKNPLELRDELRKLSSKKFDLVFFSPFSYEFTPEYAQLAEWRRSFMADSAVQTVAQAAWREASVTLDLIADLFDCPIHVHNSAAIIREESATKRRVKLTATARIRAVAKERVNALLVEHVRQKNSESYQHLFVLDEDRMVREFGELEAGAFFYRTALQHPVAFGRILATAYADIIFVNAWLMKKKLVVCDLDNTLWEGVIGEGSVEHYHDRQAPLKALKRKGVVLAICSKNDPANVHWGGGTLADEDFVCTAISWEPKVQGMKHIQAALNLKMKDYVFVDDREDERELVKLTYPEVLCLDATDPATWRRLGLWGELLEDDPDMDRTLMYRQREQRKAFVKEDMSSEEEKAALFAALQLKLTISRARTDDLKRIAELINRTNQFNLEGRRTSFKEVEGWHRSADHLIVTGQTADRFGDMGTTCVAVVRCADMQMDLLAFVLSCRVFGYGIERGVLNYLKSVASDRRMTTVVGRYVETAQNLPCKDFLSSNGFRESAGHWSFDVRDAATPDAPWLEIAVPSA